MGCRYPLFLFTFSFLDFVLTVAYRKVEVKLLCHGQKLRTLQQRGLKYHWQNGRQLNN